MKVLSWKVMFLVVAMPVVARADALNNLAGPRASKWGDSSAKVIQAEGRDPAVTISGACAQFSNVLFENRPYDITYNCFERGRSIASEHGWRPGKKIATVAYTPTPFTGQGDPKAAFAWWEGELTQKYGKPQTELDVPLGQGQEIVELWPHWCPGGLGNLMGWDSGDCPAGWRFTSYRRWTGKRTIIELFDRGAHLPINPPEVVVVFTERSFFDAAEKAHTAAVNRISKNLAAQAKSRKVVPGF
jgi:hypothetical protein